MQVEYNDVVSPAHIERLKQAHDFEFDPTCGYTFDELTRVSAPADPPDDFSAFWGETYRIARARDEDLYPTLTAWDETDTPGVEVCRVRYTSWDNAVIHGWITRPVGRDPIGLLVGGHGYGGRDAPEPHWSASGFICLFPVARGFPPSTDPRYPDEAFSHVIHGIETRDSYILRGCVAEIWHAVSVLTSLYPEYASHITYFGGSFGGGIGALALPWDPRVRRAFLAIPTFGNHPLRMSYPCVGSTLALQKYVQKHPEAWEVLRYYDAATAATFCEKPVITTAALFDPAVTPPGQYSVANSFRHPESELLPIPCAHFDPPAELAASREQEERSLARVTEFLQKRD